jgi:hypothetical protein
MTSPGWNWFDSLVVGYGLLGSTSLVVAVVWSSLPWPARYSILLLGSIVVCQAAIFWVLRWPYRRMSTTAAGDAVN